MFDSIESRFVLAKFSVRNIKPSNSKVLKLSLVSFFAFVFLTAVYFATNVILDLPYSILVEACAVRFPEVFNWSIPD